MHTLPLSEIPRIAARHGFDLQTDVLKLDDSGLDFITTLAKSRADEQTWVLRFPRRTDVIPGLHHERNILNLVKTRLQVPVPNWQIVTDEMVAYVALEGIPAGTIDPELGDYVWHIDPNAPPQAYITSVAHFLVRLHGIDRSDVQNAGFATPSIAEVRDTLATNMDQTRKLLDVPYPRWARWRDWIENDKLWPPESRFIHGDFHPGHTLVNAHDTLSGVIDWTEASMDDPCKDFVVFHAAFGESVLQNMMNQYQAAGGKVWPGMKRHIIERWNANPVEYALFALRTGNPTHMENARASMEWGA
ncbi:MAG: macrolide 2'-phosphotransferase [Verrucomicrobia bacterium]|nr:macrolide 2'-phosphotransferase [Verrucomicrobiota bacterium]MCH8514331.1 macrolide 2'-phosphotransferase [Kiritimatiellia bacterium]